MSSTAASGFSYLLLNTEKADGNGVSLDLVVIPPEASDADLIASVQSCNNEALGLLFRRYASLVRNAGERILRD